MASGFHSHKPVLRVSCDHSQPLTYLPLSTHGAHNVSSRQRDSYPCNLAAWP